MLHCTPLTQSSLGKKQSTTPLKCSCLMRHKNQQQDIVRLVLATFSQIEREHIVDKALNKTENKI